MPVEQRAGWEKNPCLALLPAFSDQQGFLPAPISRGGYMRKRCSANLNHPEAREVLRFMSSD